MTDEPAQKKTRQRRSKIQWPVRALIHVPGQRAPRVIEGTQVMREGLRYIFTVPDNQRPYIQRTVIVYDSPGLVIELEQMLAQTPQAYAPSALVQQVEQAHAGEVLRLAPSPQTSGPLRARVGPGGPPASEAHDEQGNRVILPAAFGLSVG